MKLYSTNNPRHFFSLEEAVLKGLPADNGLFMPATIPVLEKDFIQSLDKYSFQEIAFRVAKALIGKSIPASDLENIITASVNFPAPVIHLDKRISVLELFHGPSLAFKDFGARFMAQTMSYFNRDKDEDLVILVATSGDTGGAVAAGFYDTAGIEVVILYPSGKVSPLQEKQLTTLGKNITALEVDGTFDDCQSLVKKAFLDTSLNQKIRLSSANSINIARLIPQSFYYFEAYKQVKQGKTPIVFCVPSGNFGNLTAGILAKKMGLPVHHFVAATNINNIIPAYLKSGIYQPKKSLRTISNAMDVGNPSNFARMEDIFSSKNNSANKCSTWNTMKEEIYGYSINDSQTRIGIKEVFEKYNYTIDPHGAVGYMAIQQHLATHPNIHGVILETAHPSKFVDEVNTVLNRKTEIPERLAKLADLPKEATSMTTQYHDFKTWLQSNY